MNKKFILFDLDGTIIDSGLGITNALQYALNCFDIEVEDRTTLFPFIGPPLRDSLIKHYGFTRDNVEEITAKYREYYSTKGVLQNILYDGIIEVLEYLKHSGKKIILATSKPEVFAKRILDELEISHYFTFIAGSELDGRRDSKSEVIRYAMSNCNITAEDLHNAIMIGDSKYDIIGAKEVGMESIGITHGFGILEDLVAEGVDYIVRDARELLQLLESDI